MTVNSELILFEIGVKPALLVSGFKSIRREEPTKGAIIVDERLSKYPHIYFPLRGSKLYFQNADDCKQFADRGTRYITVQGQRYFDFKQDDLGIALGFPPSAVDFFSTTTDEDWRNTPRYQINYYGIQFVCHRDDVENCLTWCNKTYHIPNELKTHLPHYVRDLQDVLKKK